MGWSLSCPGGATGGKTAGAGPLAGWPGKTAGAGPLEDELDGGGITCVPANPGV